MKIYRCKCKNCKLNFNMTNVNKLICPRCYNQNIEYTTYEL